MVCTTELDLAWHFPSAPPENLLPAHHELLQGLPLHVAEIQTAASAAD